MSAPTLVARKSSAGRTFASILSVDHTSNQNNSSVNPLNPGTKTSVAKKSSKTTVKERKDRGGEFGLDSSTSNSSRDRRHPADGDGDRMMYGFPNSLDVVTTTTTNTTADDDSSINSVRSVGKLPDVATETMGGGGAGYEHEAAIISADFGDHGDRSFLLVDDKELLQVNNSDEFILRLGWLTAQSTPPVKVVSIFGNTGEGKSHTLNWAFFGGRPVFSTSATQSSCTLGVWAAFDPNLNTIVLDTEGLLGVSANQNRRTRLLLKVLAISDVVVYRTRSERLHNDLFQFLGDASISYLRHFTKELKSASRRCGLEGGRLSTLGPALVIFHETLHTRPLTKEKGSISCEEQVRQRFTDLNFNYEAFSALQYVGVQTVNRPTNFDGLVAAVKRHLNDVTVRLPRSPNVVFQALQTLNGKFSGDIENTVASTFPDQYFTCSCKCVSCGVRCQNSMNHGNDNIPHFADTKCKYQHQFDNHIFTCKHCHEQGREEVVVPKTSAASDSTWMGLAKYAWAGYILECSVCGIIYRSRQYWYGNRDPVETVVRTEIQHVWSGGCIVLQGTQNAAQKVLDGVGYISNTVSSIGAGPTKMLTSWMADQIAPPYWIPNSEILRCGICEHSFGASDTKHHCRACGHGFCDDCSNYFRPVPSRGWGPTPVRVCMKCHKSSGNSDSEEWTKSSEELRARRVGEILCSTVDNVVSAIDYPIGLIKEKARPAYWVRDEDLTECRVCHSAFHPVKLPIHHCRACGHGVCDHCSPDMRPVPHRGWDQPVRVCKPCIGKGEL